MGGASRAKVHEVPAEGAAGTVGKFLQKDLISEPRSCKDASFLLFFIYSCTHVPKRLEATYSKTELHPVLWGSFRKGSGYPKVRGTPEMDLTAAFPARSKEAQKGVLEASGKPLPRAESRP